MHLYGSSGICHVDIPFKVGSGLQHVHTFIHGTDLRRDGWPEGLSVGSCFSVLAPWAKRAQLHPDLLNPLAARGLQLSVLPGL